MTLRLAIGIALLGPAGAAAQQSLTFEVATVEPAKSADAMNRISMQPGS